MIRRLVDQAFNSGKYYISAVGLSTDVKPTEGIITGSKFVEVDTGIGYLFDETSGEWHENQQLSAAVQAYFEDHPEAIDQAAIEAMFGDQLDGIEEDIGGLKSALTPLPTIQGDIFAAKTEKEIIFNKVLNNSGNQTDSATKCISPFIDVRNHRRIFVYTGAISTYIGYNENKEFVDYYSVSAEGAGRYLPNTVYFVRINMEMGDIESAYLQDMNTNEIFYWPWYTWSKYKKEFVKELDGTDYIDASKVHDATQDATQDEINAQVLSDISGLENAINTFDIVLPKRVPIVAGQQMNFYNDNFILGVIGDGNYFDYSISSLSPVSKMLDKNLQVNPVSNVSQYSTIAIKNKKTNETVKSASFYIDVISPLASQKKVIFIGDSLTDIGYYPAEIEHNLSNGMLQSIGTRSRTVTIDGQIITSYNEGRGGWSPNDYVTKSQIDSVVNAFWNPNTSKFDFSYYMSNNGFSSVDCVVLALGTNGTANKTQCVDAINEMITSIHAYNSNIVIIVPLITGGASQNGWGNLLHTASADAFKYTQLELNKAYLTEFEDAIPNVHVCPWYLNLDTENDFPVDQYSLSSRNPTLVTMQSNNVHPALYGYLKMADVLWASISYYLS